MSINGININFGSTDGPDRNRRAAVIAALPLFVPTAAKSHPQHVSPGYSDLGIFRRRPDPIEEDVDVSALELSSLTVTIDMAGELFAQTLERDSNFTPMINIYGVKLSKPEEDVNITDVNVRVLS